MDYASGAIKRAEGVEKSKEINDGKSFEMYILNYHPKTYPAHKVWPSMHIHHLAGSPISGGVQTAPRRPTASGHHFCQ